MNDQTIVGRVLSDVVTVFVILLLARAIADLVLTMGRVRASGAMVPVLEVIYTTTDPPLKFLRRIIPPLRVGSVAIDLGFTILIVALLAVQSTALQRI